MRPLLPLIALFFCPQLFAQGPGFCFENSAGHARYNQYSGMTGGPTPAVVTYSKSGVPLLAGPGSDCRVIGHLFQQTKLPICIVCEKVDRNGLVWAQVEVRGWVKVRECGTKLLRRKMTRDHQWEVLPCRGSKVTVCTCLNSGEPVCGLEPCAVVNKVSPGLPKCDSIYVCFSGWVVKRCPKGEYLREIAPGHGITMR